MRHLVHFPVRYLINRVILGVVSDRHSVAADLKRNKDIWFKDINDKYKIWFVYKKSRIRETLNLFTGADSSTYTKTDRNGDF